MKNIFILVSLLALVASCANMNYAPRIELFGETSDTSALENKADLMKWASAKKIKAYIGKYPKGISFDQNGNIKTSSKYKVLGKVYTNFKRPSPMHFWLKGFYDYPDDQDWKDVYCGVQTPLHWVTLGFWYLVPLDYPCAFLETNNTKSVQKRKSRIIKTLKKMTKAAGGDILIITSLGQLKTINAATKETLSTLDMVGAEGYAIKIIKK